MRPGSGAPCEALPVIWMPVVTHKPLQSHFVVIFRPPKLEGCFPKQLASNDRVLFVGCWSFSTLTFRIGLINPWVRVPHSLGSRSHSIEKVIVWNRLWRFAIVTSTVSSRGNLRAAPTARRFITDAPPQRPQSRSAVMKSAYSMGCSGSTL